MLWSSWLHFGMITVGAMVLALSAHKAMGLCGVLEFVREQQRARVRRALRGLAGLLAFFCLAYILLALSLALRHELVDAHLVSLVLLGGSIFCWLSISLAALLLRELQRTLSGIVPICGHCKKVRREQGCPDNPADWQRIESYISERAGVDFSHGLCPECFSHEMQILSEVDR
jgi:hypothetical protein